jgi:hypothetical protein
MEYEIRLMSSHTGKNSHKEILMKKLEWLWNWNSDNITGALKKTKYRNKVYFMKTIEKFICHSEFSNLLFLTRPNANCFIFLNLFCKLYLILSFLKFYLIIFLIVVPWVHCGIYKSSYSTSDISYLNLPPPPFSFIPPPSFLDQFQQVSIFHLYTCVHSICTIFTLPHPFSTSSTLPLVSIP